MAFSVFLLFYFSLFSPPVNRACDPIDREALLGFKAYITDDPYGLLHSWKSSTNCCTHWEGIVCDSTGRVVELTRQGYFYIEGYVVDTCMKGTLSPSLGNLSSLDYLDLSSNNLTGPIPPEIGKLSHLTYLSLNENLLTGEIPSSIGKLVSLTILDLSSNKFTGNIPVTIGNLSNITSIDLDYNKLSGELPPTIGLLENLVSLTLSENQFTGKIPSSIGNLQNLTFLYILANNLSGPIPPQLVNITYLDTLDLSFNPQLLSSIPDWISEMNLSALLLAQTGISGELPEWLSSSSIWALDLSSNGLTGKLPRWIGNMTNLDILNLSKNRFYSSIPQEFKNLSGLWGLDLSYNNFSGNLKSIFSKEINFDFRQGFYYYIYLSHNMFTGPIDDDIGEQKSMASIHNLRLSYNPLGGTIPKSLGNLSELIVLQLAGTGLSGMI